MRHMSFALTTPQIFAGTKTVTRRLGWAELTPGVRLQAIEKGQGLKKGESPRLLRVIRVVSVRRERLNLMTKHHAYGVDECRREGFPRFTPEEFVRFFCDHNKCASWRTVTRIEFAYEVGE